MAQSSLITLSVLADSPASFDSLLKRAQRIPLTSIKVQRFNSTYCAPLLVSWSANEESHSISMSLDRLACEFFKIPSDPYLALLEVEKIANESNEHKF